MPGRDKTGPQGMGSMTGKHRGICAGNEFQNNQKPFGFGHGQEKGNRRGLEEMCGGIRFRSQRKSGNNGYLLNQIDILKKQVETLEEKLQKENNNEK